MELTSKTRINDLLGAYPFLLDFFLARSPKYRLLKNPVSRRTLGKLASLSQVASIGGQDLDQLLLDIAAEIRDKTGEEVVSEDRKARQEILKSIIRDLHAGVEIAILKQRFQNLISDIDASEIAAMEQALIAEGMPESEIKRLCDVHVQVFQDSLESHAAPKVPPGHPVYTYMLENRAAEKITLEISQILAKTDAVGDEEFFRQHKVELEQSMERLAAIDLHYLRKENQLFPILEGYDVTGPSQVMWALHDDIRDAIKTSRRELEASQGREALNTIRYVIKSIDDMVYKEENILFPMAMETLTDSDWKKVAQGEDEIGFAWISPAQTMVAGAVAGPAWREPAQESGLVNLTTGQLTSEQVDLLLLHLPVEINFVDENDEVRYYSQVPHKIFPRSPGVIGRKVQNCHPRASLDKVERIINAFRSGEKDAADFWIDMKDRLIYIRYFAVRDKDRNYRGTIEVVQDVTDIMGLTGQRRLLDWE